MFKFSAAICAIFLTMFFTGCTTSKSVAYKSPCASINGGPCERYSVNDWWLEGESGPRLVKAIV